MSINSCGDEVVGDGATSNGMTGNGTASNDTIGDRAVGQTCGQTCASASTPDNAMYPDDRERWETRAQILKALAHPSRIFIMERLNLRPHCVNELTGLIGSDTSTVSKHLSVLKNAGLVEIRKEGTTVYYSLTCPCVITLLDCIEGVIERNLEKQLAYFSKDSRE